jgi:phage repressor protein C with HTH and peptisase S24 domain
MGNINRSAALSNLMVKAGLSASTLARELQAKGVKIGEDYIRKLASGRRELDKTSPDLRGGLKSIFKLSDEQWQETFELYAPASQVQISRPRYSSPTENFVNVEAYAANGGKISEYLVSREDYRQNMFVFYVDGDSMTTGDPNSIRSGDILYVDRNATDLIDVKIYLLEVRGGGVSIKRARRIIGKWIFMSDNLEHESLEANEITIIGRVFKAIGERKL